MSLLPAAFFGNDYFRIPIGRLISDRSEKNIKKAAANSRSSSSMNPFLKQASAENVLNFKRI